MRMRFGSVGLIAGAMASAIICYTVSLRVAAERSGVAQMRRMIAADLKDIRALEAELRTRARLPQLQRWNDEVLAMSAPTSKQFANNAIALVSYAPKANAPSILPAPGVQLAVAIEPAVNTPRVQAVSYEPDTDAEPAVATASSDRAPIKTQASLEPPKPRLRPVRIAETQAFGLSDSLMRQIEAAAVVEQARFRKASMQ